MDMIMEKRERRESASSLPVLSRLDRLDRLLQLLEEKHSFSGRHLCKAEEQEKDQCKTLSSALDEVQRKGTLMERLAMLENRALQLSLDMDEGNTSKLDRDFDSSRGDSKQEREKIMIHQRTQSPFSFKEQNSTKTHDLEKKGRKNASIGRQSKQVYKKWMGWLRMGC